MSLDVGDAAPPFTLTTGDGSIVSLADAMADRDVILYFYPKDDTPGCTAEACSFRDNLAAVQAHGAAVYGISPDSAKSHAKFAAKHSLSFPLLADPDHTVAEAYGVWVEKSMYGRKYMGIERTTFHIGRDGTIRNVWRKVNPNKHVAEVIAALDG